MECPICLDLILDGQKILSCTHQVCQKCFEMLLVDPICPICRKPITEKIPKKGEPIPFKEEPFEAETITQFSNPETDTLFSKYKNEVDAYKQEYQKYLEEVDQYRQFIQRLKSLAKDGYDISMFDQHRVPIPPRKRTFKLFEDRLFCYTPTVLEKIFVSKEELEMEDKYFVNWKTDPWNLSKKKVFDLFNPWADPHGWVLKRRVKKLIAPDGKEYLIPPKLSGRWDIVGDQLYSILDSEVSIYKIGEDNFDFIRTIPISIHGDDDCVVFLENEIGIIIGDSNNYIKMFSPITGNIYFTIMLPKLNEDCLCGMKAILLDEGRIVVSFPINNDDEDDSFDSFELVVIG